MDKSKKIILISFLPIIFTVLFALYAMIPAIESMNKTKITLKEETDSLALLNGKIADAKNNKANLKIVEKLKEKLGNFSEQTSYDYDSALMVFDGEKIAQLSGVKLVNFNIRNEQEGKEEDADAIKRRNQNATNPNEKKTEEKPLAILTYTPADIVITGSYLEIIDFITNIESYQRKITVDNIEIKRSKDKKSEKIEATLNCKFYKVKEADNPEA